MSRSAPALALAGCLAAACLSGGPAPAAAAQARKDVRIGEVIAGSPLWSEWSRRYVRPSGRVVDTAARGSSHSEGQGYGMLLAVAAGDRPAFDRIWTWARTNLSVRGDSLFAWRWDPFSHTVSDRNNATDGDILIAWALAEAADVWEAPEYAAAAASIAADISRHAVIDAVGAGPVLLPATFGFARADQPDGPVVNLSYWIYPAFHRLAQLAPGQDWERIRQTGLAIIDAIQAQPPGAVTNWTGLADSRAAPARRFPARVGYDAMRVPLYLAFSPRENAERLARFDSMFPPGAAGVPIVDLRSGETEEVASGRGYRAIASLRACVVGGQPFPREFYWLGEDEAYYPATLHALAILAALVSNSECLDPVEASRLQPLGWARRATGELARFLSPKPVAAAAPPQQTARAVPVYAVMPPAAASEEDPGTNRFFRIGAPLGAVLALVGFIVVSRRSRTPSFVAGTTAPVLRERSPAPRCLPENPFHAARGEKALEERLDIAARASWDWQRTAAVAYFRANDYGDIVVMQGALAAQKVVAAMVAALSSRVRKSDAVTLLAPNEIVVCLSLIADEVDLASVGRRLTGALREAHPAVGEGDNLFGLALYLPEGTGAQCVAEARAAFDTLHPSRPAPKAAAGHAPRAPRKRKAKTPTPAEPQA